MSAPRAFRSSRGLGLAVLTFMDLNAVIAVVEAGLRLAERGLLRRIARGEIVSAAEAARSDDRIAAVAGIGIGLLGVTGILWLVWQHRAQANLHAAHVPALRFTPGWAVGWWFVPFANLVKPFQTMRELWKASGGGPEWQRVPTWPVIGWWWAVLAAALLGIALVRSVIEWQETLEPVPVPGIGVSPRPDRPELGG